MRVFCADSLHSLWFVTFFGVFVVTARSFCCILAKWSSHSSSSNFIQEPFKTIFPHLLQLLTNTRRQRLYHGWTWLCDYQRPCSGSCVLRCQNPKKNYYYFRYYRYSNAQTASKSWQKSGSSHNVNVAQWVPGDIMHDAHACASNKVNDYNNKIEVPSWNRREDWHAITT